MQFLDWLYAVYPNAKRSGNEIQIDCPSCGVSESGTPNASVNVVKMKYHCWRCDDGGGVERLITRVEGCRYDEIPSIVSLDRSRARLDASEIAGEEEIDIELPEGYRQLYTGANRGNLTRKIHAYAESRGWDRRTAKIYKLGYCIVGRYRGRIVIPFYENGSLVGFQARTVLPVSKPDNPKYLGPSVRHTIFNIDNQKQGGIAWLHEGPADAIATGGMAKLGTYLSYHQKTQLLGLKLRRLYVWGDKDAKRADIEMAKELSRHMKVSIYLEHEAKDAGDAKGLEIATALGKCIKVNPANVVRAKRMLMVR